MQELVPHFYSQNALFYKNQYFRMHYFTQNRLLKRLILPSCAFLTHDICYTSCIKTCEFQKGCDVANLEKLSTPKILHMSEKRKCLEYFGRRLISPFPSMFSPFAGTTSPPKLRSHYRANTNILPLKTKIIYFFFTFFYKILHI